jgi:hypothetical protein
MIAGIFHGGSGLGDQLFRYITVRTLAEDKGFDFAMVNPEDFKGDFFQCPIPQFVRSADDPPKFLERDVRESGDDIRSFDPEINFVRDGTVIDGSFEDFKYWGHNLDNINKWLSVEPLDLPDDLCVVGFRGGEYSLFRDLFLPGEYYDMAIAEKRRINPNMRFQVHTDDTLTARKYFPDFEIVENQQVSHSKHTNMALNWRSMRFAKHAIIPNSAFFIIPRLLRHNDGESHTIAPRYWAGYNQKIWKRPACFYKPFSYIHHEIHPS